MSSITNTISDILVLTQRNLIRYRRIPQLIIFSTVQPVMFLLLFNYVFGGALRLPPGQTDYINFLLPGIVVQSALFGSSQASVGIAEDMASGLIERLRSLPMAASAVIIGKVFADTLRNIFVVVIMVGVGFLLGFRFQDGVANGLLGVTLAILFGFAFSWIAVTVGLIVKNPEAALPAGFIWIFPLVFASAIFVPVETMPGWLQGFAKNQPVTKIVEAIRSFTAGGSHDAVLPSLLWIIGITLVFLFISIRLYRRAK